MRVSTVPQPLPLLPREIVVVIDAVQRAVGADRLRRIIPRVVARVEPPVLLLLRHHVVLEPPVRRVHRGGW